MKEIAKKIIYLSKEYSEVISRDIIISLLNEIRNVLFIGYNEKFNDINEYVNDKLIIISDMLNDLLLKLNVDNHIDITKSFINELPNIKDRLNGDIKAFLASDPAVINDDEIILCYPGFYAISTYRIANSLSGLSIPTIPRIISEHAHSKTGIDIHPKATIDENFFIDHGTGVVIGETSNIGKNVKIYQGVTLGALSLSNIEELKNTKRHPTIEDNVTIYSGASILGGETVIGINSVIGSNVFITKSVTSNSKVIFTNYDQLHKIKEI